MPLKISTIVQGQIVRAIEILKNGGVVAYPTDTVYGLGASANLTKAVERIFELKQRQTNMALPLLLADIEQMNDVAKEIPDVAWILAEHFLPGALTIVLKKRSSVLDLITAGSDTIAVRVPDHSVPIAIIKGICAPLVGTSANISGMPSVLTSDEVKAQFDDRLDLIIDGGRCPGGIESTVVDVTGEKPIILREGAIPLEKLKKVCGNIELKRS